MAHRGPPIVTLHRFFVPPDSISNGILRFPPDQSHQIRKVLRLRVGDRVTALAGDGIEYSVRLEELGREVSGVIEDQQPSITEPGASLTLYQSLLKGSKLELVLQKCTEIGVNTFVPVLTQRSVPTAPNADRARRWEAIVREAAEQSGRGALPHISPPITYSEALAHAASCDITVLAWEGEHANGLASLPLQPSGSVGLFVGPEGGFTEDEVQAARNEGTHIISLGPTVLRAETAAIVGSALVLARCGDLQ